MFQIVWIKSVLFFFEVEILTILTLIITPTIVSLAICHFLPSIPLCFQWITVKNEKKIRGKKIRKLPYSHWKHWIGLNFCLFRFYFIRLIWVQRGRLSLLLLAYTQFCSRFLCQPEYPVIRAFLNAVWTTHAIKLRAHRTKATVSMKNNL